MKLAPTPATGYTPCLSERFPQTMIKLTEKIEASGSEETTLTLSLHDRIKSRLRATLDNGADAARHGERSEGG